MYYGISENITIDGHPNSNQRKNDSVSVARRLLSLQGFNGSEDIFFFEMG
jgi:hypothetical protein